MYNKINRGAKNNNDDFKPRRMVVNGVVHNIDSIETLQKIKDQHQQKKEEELEKVEEQKHQKVLIKRTRKGTTDEKVVKIVKDIGQMQNRNTASNQSYKKPVNQPVDEKPAFKLTSLACKRRIEPKPLTSMSQKSLLGQTEQEKIIENNAKIFDHVDNKNGKSNTNENVFVDKNDEPGPQSKPLKIVRSNTNQIKKLKPNNTTNTTNTTNTNNATNTNIQLENIQESTLPINEENNEDVLSTHAENSDGEEIQNDAEVTTKQFQVIRSQWYVLALKSNLKSSGLIKIFDAKVPVMPVIRINNDMFLYKKHANFAEYRIYFKTLVNTSNVDIYLLGLNIIDLKLQKVTFDIVAKSIDIWKLRKLYDLEYINYYSSNVKLDTTDKFIDRINAEYELLKNPNYFDHFIKSVKIDNRNITKDSKKVENKINVLYLTYSNIEYEQNGYNTRTQYLLQNINDDKYKVFGVTRYGYPFDKEVGYYQEPPNITYSLDNVDYFKLLTKEDNFNTNNLVDYLKKYIIAVVKLAIETDAKIIHGVSNYWSGIAALYASKYLGLKCIYEIRGFMEENILLIRPELKGSDVLRMIKGLEDKVLSDCDRIITVNKALKKKLISNGVNENKIEVVNNGVSTEIFTPNETKRDELREKYKINSDDVIIGYIGTISNYEGIEYIIESLKKLLAEGYSVKFLMIGEGNYKNDIVKVIQEYRLDDHVIILDKMKHSDVIPYYNMVDIVVYPRKKYDMCHLLGSTKLLESMSMEKAIIVSNLESNNEIINQDTGLFCEPNNTEDLLYQIKLLLDNDTLRINLGKNAREWVQQNRNWNLSKESNNSIYDKLV